MNLGLLRKETIPRLLQMKNFKNVRATTYCKPNNLLFLSFRVFCKIENAINRKLNPANSNIGLFFLIDYKILTLVKFDLHFLSWHSTD
jgi:hypothetical protein